jgi:signal transduction histidine kinase
VTSQTRYFALSWMPTPEVFLTTVRDHWAMENALHWQLDVLFREDAARNSKGNVAVLRRRALDVVWRDTAKGFLTIKLKRTGWDETFSCSILNGLAEAGCQTRLTWQWLGARYRDAKEIRSVGVALNGLLGRVNTQRVREKAFTSFATHELKTPIAAIKTQAQIASMAPGEATLKTSSAHIQQGIGRTNRMVRSSCLWLCWIDATQERRSGS